jgi:hypothetical protein
MIHQDVPHHLRRHSEKVGPVLPFRRVLADQTKVSFVNQCRTLQCVIGALVPQMAACHPTQLIVDQGYERISRILIAVPPIGEQPTDLSG